MFTKWFRAVLAVGCAGWLAGCGGSGGGSGDAPAPVEPVPVGVATRLAISPPGGLMTNTSERRTLTVHAFDANGTEVALPAGVSVATSSGAFGLTATATGYDLTAGSIGSSTLIVATGASLVSSPVLFYAAEPAADAVLISDAQVLAAPVPVDPDAERGVGFRYRTTLAAVGLPAAQTLMVGTGAQPIAGRVVSASANANAPANTDVVLELVPLPTLFANLDVRAEFTPEQLKQMMVTTPARKTIASAGRVHRLSVPGATCKGDGPALALLSGELEAEVDPHLRFDIVTTIVNHQPQQMRFAAYGSLDVSGKAVVNLGASITGGVTCKAMLGSIPIPITGPLSPFIAPVIPLDAKFELGAQISANLFSFSAEFKQSAEMDFGIDYDVTRAPDLQLQAIKRLAFGDPELNRNVTFPHEASLRVKASAFLGLSSGLALGGRLARLEVIEVYAGPEFEIKFGGSYDVANDSVYTSEYELKGKAGIGPGEHVQKFIETVLLSPKAIDLSAKLEKSIARTASATELSVDKYTFVSGDELTFTLQLDPATVNFPLVGYNVSEVRIYRLDHRNGRAQQIASVVPSAGQTNFEMRWTADSHGDVDDAGETTFYAFLVDKPLAAISASFPFELGPVRTKSQAPLFKVAGTGTAVYAIDNGVLRAIGTNNGGALGAGLPIGQVAGEVTVPLADVRSVTGSAWHASALLGDGSVWSWGWGPAISVIGGQPVDNPLPLPVAVKDSPLPLTGVVSINSGLTDTVAVKADGSVWQFGRVGPARRIDGLPAIVAAAQGMFHTLFLSAGGAVFAVGSNQYGQLGDGSFDDKVGAVAVPGMTDVVAIAAGSVFSLALKKDGSVWSWGNNENGELGLALIDGGVDVRSHVKVPTKVPLFSGATRISAGENHAMALQNGVVYVWGYGANGQIGKYGEVPITQYSVCSRKAPVHFPTFVLTNVIDIDAGEFQSLAVLRNGAVMRWGTLPGLGVPCEPITTPLFAR